MNAAVPIRGNLGGRPDHGSLNYVCCRLRQEPPCATSGQALCSPRLETCKQVNHDSNEVIQKQHNVTPCSPHQPDTGFPCHGVGRHGVHSVPHRWFTEIDVDDSVPFC